MRRSQDVCLSSPIGRCSCLVGLAVLFAAGSLSHAQSVSDLASLSGANEPVLRTIVQTEDGVLVVYDAAVPSPAFRLSAGYLAYWNDFETDDFTCTDACSSIGRTSARPC